jgi:glycosyltransferase involved in cell wall biosynthesis
MKKGRSKGGRGEKRINILFMIDQLKGGAGTERHLLTLATGLDRRRFNPAICSFEGNDEYLLKEEERLKKEGVVTINLNLERIYSPLAPFKAMRLKRLIKENDIDIVQTFHFKADTYGTFVSRMSGVSRIISSRRDTGELKSPRQVLLNRLMNRFVCRYIMVCDAVGRKFHESEAIPFERMTTIYNGVDMKRFDPAAARDADSLRASLGIRPGDFVVGTTAIFRPEKAYHIFFEGMEKALPLVKGLKVLVMGFGQTKERFEEHCRKGPLKDAVRFLGYVDDVERYLTLMDVFALVPNRNEGFSNAILEAMASGRPVIASDVGGNAEAVVHNTTGIIIAPDDSQGLAEAIIRLHREPGLRLDMGRKSRKRAGDAFSLEKMIENHEDLYERVFSGRC